MGIYISGMEMPTSRPIYVVIDAAGQARRYDLNNDRYADKELFEAIPVPPHGDLIDRDALISNHTITQYDWSEVIDVEDVRNAPTIIPAEEDEV